MISDYERIGHDFCDALFLKYCSDINIEKISNPREKEDIQKMINRKKKCMKIF